MAPEIEPEKNKVKVSFYVPASFDQLCREYAQRNKKTPSEVYRMVFELGTPELLRQENQVLENKKIRMELDRMEKE